MRPSDKCAISNQRVSFGRCHHGMANRLAITSAILSGEMVGSQNERLCDFTPTLCEVIKDIDAFSTPDNQGFYGFHRGYGVYFEVIDYNKMLRDATKRNRIFFDKLNLVDTH